MIISKKYAHQLIRKGKAQIIDTCRLNTKIYHAIIRFDLQRVDHYLIHII